MHMGADTTSTYVIRYRVYCWPLKSVVLLPWEQVVRSNIPPSGCATAGAVRSIGACVLEPVAAEGREVQGEHSAVGAGRTRCVDRVGCPI